MMRFPSPAHPEPAGVDPAASSAGAEPSASAPADPGPDYMDVDLRGDEDDDEMGVGLIEDHCIHYYHQSIWNDFASIESMMEVGSSSTVFKEHFAGIDIQVEVPLEVHDELTGMLDHAQVIEGMRTEVKQLEVLKVGKNLTESSARKLAKEKGTKILTSRWVNTQKTPTLARCRLVVRDFASGAESAFRSGIYAPTSSLDSLHCVLALASLWDLWLITADVSTAFMYAEVEEDACDLVLLPSNISFKGERVVCLLFKAMNGLRRAPLLWLCQLQRTVYALGGEDTFESTLFRISTKKGLILVLVYADDLLIASQDQKEGEDFLAKLMAIWKMKTTGRIGRQTKGALEFLGRSIYRAKDGESALYFGVSRQYMVGIFESWGENVKAGHTGLMPKLEDVHKEYVKKFGEDPLTEKGEQRYRRVLGQLAWAALSRAASLVNFAVAQNEGVTTHTIDHIASILAFWMRSGSWSAGDSLLAKCWDLSGAHKQVPLSDEAFHLHSYLAVFDPSCSSAKIFKKGVLPFGSIASVTAFLPVSLALWKVGSTLLHPMWSVYFHDFLCLARSSESKHVDFCVDALFSLLGWKISKNKLLDFNTLCKVLGVQLDLKQSGDKLCFVTNTEERVEELVCELDEALHTKLLFRKAPVC